MKNLKVGMVSYYPPEQCGIAIYTTNLLKHLKGVEVITIGTKRSKAKYRIDLTSLFLYKTLQKTIAKEGLSMIHIQYVAPYYGGYTLNLGLIHALKKMKIPTIV